LTEKRGNQLKRILSETQSTTQSFPHNLSLGAFLRTVGLSSLIVFSLFIFSTVWPVVYNKIAYTLAPQAAKISSSADIAIVVDNINEIGSHDPTGARFIAAQMFVDQAQSGDRIGVVRIPRSNSSAAIKLLDLTTIQNSDDRNTIKQVLTQRFFGPVNPSSRAYFVPAFQKASQMLLSAQDNNSKYMIILTDSVAQSGDQTSCSSASGRYHQWFCEIPKLKSQNISVIFVCFTIPGHEAELQPTRQYLQRYGAIVLQVG
jgi:hypothetical protein